MKINFPSAETHSYMCAKHKYSKILNTKTYFTYFSIQNFTLLYLRDTSFPFYTLIQEPILVPSRRKPFKPYNYQQLQTPAHIMTHHPFCNDRKIHYLSQPEAVRISGCGHNTITDNIHEQPCTFSESSSKHSPQQYYLLHFVSQPHPMQPRTIPPAHLRTSQRTPQFSRNTPVQPLRKRKRQNMSRQKPI